MIFLVLAFEHSLIILRMRVKFLVAMFFMLLTDLCFLEVFLQLSLVFTGSYSF